MQSITANEAKTRFGELIDRVQREPVRVTRHSVADGPIIARQRQNGSLENGHYSRV